MSKLRVNAPVDQAVVAADRYAQLAGELASIEEGRTAAIAATNAAADALTRPLVEQLDALRAELEPWWRRNANQVTGGKRRSAELGGCMLGLRAGRAKVVFALGEDKAAVTSLVGTAWQKTLLKQSFTLDRAAIGKALEGRRAADVQALGFAIEPAAETFFIDRVAQAGVGAPN